MPSQQPHEKGSFRGGYIYIDFVGFAMKDEPTFSRRGNVDIVPLVLKLGAS
jgi:hypothetical protein